MATEEITISELELADEVLADMVMAVETASDTKAITLKQLKAYLGSNLPTGFILPAVGRISDERFTLLDGKTLAKAGGYEAFYNKVQSEVEKGNWYACTEEEFNADVAKYGQCGRFVLTAEYVRIPKITRFLGATVTLSEIGKTYAESLPNIKGKWNSYAGLSGGAYPEGAVYSESIVQTGAMSGGGDPKQRLVLEASRSSSTYQDGAKVQPDHTRYPYYMVVSTEGQSEPISVDINKVYEDIEASLSTKANIDLSNISSNIDYVVEQGSNYMKFKSKKLICWGDGSDKKTFSFPKPFANTHYRITMQGLGTNTNQSSYGLMITNKTTTGATVGWYGSQWTGWEYIAIGQGA